MATKINTPDLKVGMFVADLDRPWVDTPFLLQGFLIEDEEQIATLKMHCEFVIIDRARYEVHPDCKALVCFVYDPEGKIGNPVGIERDLEKVHGPMKVRVIIAPRGD